MPVDINLNLLLDHGLVVHEWLKDARNHLTSLCILHELFQVVLLVPKL